MHSGPADQPPSVIAESKGAEYLAQGSLAMSALPASPLLPLAGFLSCAQCSPPVKPSSKLRVKDVPRPRQVTLQDQGQ